MPFPCIYDGNRPILSTELPSWMLPQRTRVLTQTETASNCKTTKDSGCVLYWMQRDVRTVDNWGLLLAQHLAQMKKLPLRVVHVLASPPPASSCSNENNKTNDTPPQLKNYELQNAMEGFCWAGLSASTTN